MMATTTDLRKSYTDYAKNLTSPKPFYAVAGVGGQAVEILKDVPARLREELSVEKLKSVPDRVRTEFTASDGRVKKVADRLVELGGDPRKLTDLADEQVKAADKMLVEYAKRGEKVFDRVFEDNKQFVQKAKQAARKVNPFAGAATVPSAPATAGPRKTTKTAPATPAEAKTS
jgi:ribosomal protein S17E